MRLKSYPNQSAFVILWAQKWLRLSVSSFRLERAKLNSANWFRTALGRHAQNLISQMASFLSSRLVMAVCVCLELFVWACAKSLPKGFASSTGRWLKHPPVVRFKQLEAQLTAQRRRWSSSLASAQSLERRENWINSRTKCGQKWD